MRHATTRMWTSAWWTGAALMGCWLTAAACAGRDAATGQVIEDPRSPPISDVTDSIVAVADTEAVRIGLQWAVVSRRAFQRTTQTTGTVELDLEHVADQVARIAGWLDRVDVHAQDPVTVGDTLVLLYSPDYLLAQSNLLQSHRQLEAARAAGDPADLRAATALVASARERLRLLGASDTAVARVLQTGTPESHLAVRSPLTGIVMEADATRGAHVNPGDRLFRIADPSQLWVAVDLYEADLRFVGPGDLVDVTVNAYPGDRFRGRVARVGAVLDPESRTVKARAVLQNTGRRLKPGMFAAVIVRPSGPGHASLAVAASAVQQIGDSPVVFVRSGPGRYVARRIEVGLQEEGFVEIRSGLTPRDSVVTHGSFALKSELLKASFGDDEG